MPSDGRISAMLSAYVPAVIQARIAEGRDTFDQPRCAPLSAAVLFADLSGFTQLTAHYERQGRLGLEHLTEVLNQYFSRTIAQVSECGGDIESISGDGLVAFWPVLQGRDLHGCVRHATECARRLHDAVGGVQSDGPPLRLRAAVVCGDAFAMEVGALDTRRHFLLSGTPLFEITETIERAKPGQTALSAAAASHLEPAAVSADRALHSGADLPIAASPPPRPALEDRHIGTLMRFVPRHLARLTEPGGYELFAEFRRVSVCFLRLSGLVFNAPDDLARVQQAISRADTIVERYGGGEQQLTMNDKGALLMVVFGLPGTAHEDDPVRAVLAMRELLTALDDLWLDCTCGVATGVAYCGPIGSDLRRTYTVIGSAVNLAAALSDIRGHRIVCDAETARAAGQRIAFDPLPAAAGKGLSDDTRLYRPSTRRARTAETRAILGRGGELNELVSFLDRRLSERTGVLAVVEGEAGIGKSTLLRAATREALFRDFQILAGSADAFDRSSSFRAWHQPFATLLGLEPGADHATVMRAVADWAKIFPDLAELSPLLGDVLAVSLPDTELTRHMQGTVRAQNTIAVLLRTLSDAARRKQTLLLLDDVQWLDPSSLDLLGRVDVGQLGLTVFLSTRSGGVEGDRGEFEALLKRPDVYRLRLQGMGDEAIGALLARRIGAREVPRALVDFVRERAAGNPYYSEEIAAILLDTGRLAVRDGQCVLEGSLDGLAIDGSIEGIIASRVDLLKPAEQNTVKIASVQGRVVAYEMLRGVRHLEAHEPPLPEQLMELTRREILLQLGDDPADQYLFKHLITQQAIYNRLLFSQRRELHQTVAEWMERRYADELGVHQAVIATHWSLAEQHDKAATSFERAGERSLRGGADRETISLLERALESLHKLPGRRDNQREARILRQLGDANRRRGEIVEAEQLQRRALALLNERWPRTTGGVLSHLMVEMMRQLWRRKVGGATDTTTERDTEIAYIHAHLCSIYFFQNRTAEMLLSTTRAVNAGERSTDMLHRAETYLLFSNVMGILGLHGAARRYIALADGCMPADLSLAQKMVSNEYRALYLGSVGDLLQAEVCIKDMLVGAALSGSGGEPSTTETPVITDERHYREALSLFGIITLMQGDAARSRRYRDHFFDQAMQANDAQTQCWAWIERAEHDLRRGALDAAVEGFTTATALLGKVSSTERVWIAGQLAQARLRRGELEAARETATNGLTALGAAPPAGFYAIEGCAGIADVLLTFAERGGGAADRRIARKSVGRLGTFARSFPIAKPRHLMALGRLKALAGRRGAAEALTRQALEEARRVGLPFDMALAELQLGRLAEGAARRPHLESAAVGFEATGASPLAAQAREALATA